MKNAGSCQVGTPCEACAHSLTGAAARRRIRGTLGFTKGVHEKRRDTEGVSWLDGGFDGVSAGAREAGPDFAQREHLDGERSGAARSGGGGFAWQVSRRRKQPRRVESRWGGRAEN